jgi:hypothetical protein
MRAPAVAVFALAVAALGCGEIDAENEPFVGTVLYSAPSGAFELRLLQPPWLPPIMFNGETIFVVPPADATVTPDLAVVLSQALHSLKISVVTGAPATVAQNVMMSLPEATMVSEREIRTVSGATGVEMTWSEGPATFVREAFLSAPGTSTYRLRFAAKKSNADDPMVGQMITSFRPKT